jgi:hypothetical protein
MWTMCKCPQVLSGEVDQPITSETPEDSGSVCDDDIEILQVSHSDIPGRYRRSPTWLSDYKRDLV